MFTNHYKTKAGLKQVRYAIIGMPPYPPGHSDHLPHPTYIKTLPDPTPLSGGARKVAK